MPAVDFSLTNCFIYFIWRSKWFLPRECNFIFGSKLHDMLVTNRSHTFKWLRNLMSFIHIHPHICCVLSKCNVSSCLLHSHRNLPFRQTPVAHHFHFDPFANATSTLYLFMIRITKWIEREARVVLWSPPGWSRPSHLIKSSCLVLVRLERDTSRGRMSSSRTF